MEYYKWNRSMCSHNTLDFITNNHINQGGKLLTIQIINEIWCSIIIKCDQNNNRNLLAFDMWNHPIIFYILCKLHGARVVICNVTSKIRFHGQGVPDPNLLHRTV